MTRKYVTRTIIQCSGCQNIIDDSQHYCWLCGLPVCFYHRIFPTQKERELYNIPSLLCIGCWEPFARKEEDRQQTIASCVEQVYDKPIKALRFCTTYYTKQYYRSYRLRNAEKMKAYRQKYYQKIS